MLNYQRNGRMEHGKNKAQDLLTDLPQKSAKEQPAVRINGFQQVVEMLLAADPAFRESLLKRIGTQDPELAISLRQQLRR